VPHPDRLPDLFLDRSLGRIKVPRLLRQAGLRLTTLGERYGVPADESVTDERWLRDAGDRGEAVFMKDARVRYNRAEKLAIVSSGVRCFCLARRDLPADEMAARFLRNLESITLACAEPGARLYAVHEHRIERLLLETA
jgi:PIN like domain